MGRPPLCFDCAQARPDAFLPDLARSLSVERDCLRALDRLSEAVHAIREAGSRWGRSRIRAMTASSSSVMSAIASSEWWSVAIMQRLCRRQRPWLSASDPGKRPPLRDETPLVVPLAVLVCAPPLEKAVFGSVMSAFEVAFPPLCPLWHETRENISASMINRAAIPIRFRIENNSRTYGNIPTKVRKTPRNHHH